MYLLGNVGFRLRMVGSLDYVKVAAAVVLCAVYAGSGGLPAWASASAITLLVALLCLLESTLHGEPSEQPA